MDYDELMRGLRLAGIAAVSALITATIVIGVGSAWLGPLLTTSHPTQSRSSF